MNTAVLLTIKAAAHVTAVKLDRANGHLPFFQQQCWALRESLVWQMPPAMQLHGLNRPTRLPCSTLWPHALRHLQGVTCATTDLSFESMIK